MSDITRKCFFVLHLYKDLNENVARCVAISEYILAYPALSFAIIDSYKVKARKYNQLNNVNNTSALDDTHLQDSLSGEQLPHQLMSSSSSASSLIQSVTNNPAIASDTDLVTMIRLYCIQTKQLQEMQIFLTGDQSINAYNNSSNSPPPPLPIPATQTLPFGFNATSNSLQQQSILNQLLPNASASPVRFNSVSSTSSTASSNAQLINSLTNFQAKLSLSGNGVNTNLNRLKTSNSFNSSDIKDMQSMQASSDVNASDNDNDTNDLNKNNLKLNLSKILLNYT